MAFGVATVVTTVGKAIMAKRMFGATPAQAEPKFLGMGTGATGAARTAVAGDTALTTEVETRATGTGSNPSGAIHQVTGTQSATTTRSIDEAGIFDASSTGNMYTSATLNVLSLVNGDSVTWTWQITVS